MNSEDNVSPPSNQELHTDEKQPNNQELHTDDLEWISDRLDRAIRGIFVLTFQNILRWIGSTLVSVFSKIFDLLWTLIRETARFFKKAFVWLFWTLPRKVIRWFLDSANYLLRLGGILFKILLLGTVIFAPLIISINTAQFIWVSSAWCLMAIIGAVWGLIYLNRSNWKIWQTIGRLANKLKFWQESGVTEVVGK